MDGGFVLGAGAEPLPLGKLPPPPDAMTISMLMAPELADDSLFSLSSARSPRKSSSRALSSRGSALQMPSEFSRTSPLKPMRPSGRKLRKQPHRRRGKRAGGSGSRPGRRSAAPRAGALPVATASAMTGELNDAHLRCRALEDQVASLQEQLALEKGRALAMETGYRTQLEGARVNIQELSYRVAELMASQRSGAEDELEQTRQFAVCLGAWKRNPALLRNDPALWTLFLSVCNAFSDDGDVFWNSGAARTRAEQRFKRMQAAMTAIAQEPDMNSASAALCAGASRLLQVSEAALFVRQGERLVCTQSSTTAAAVADLGEGLIGEVGLTGQAVCADDASKAPRYVPDLDGPCDGPLLALPLRFYDGDGDARVVGVLRLRRTAGGAPFNVAEDEAMLAPLISVAGGVFGLHSQVVGLTREKEKAEFQLMQIKQDHLHLGGMLEVVQSMILGRNVAEMVDTIVNATYKLVNADRVTLFLLDERNGELWCKVSQDVEGFRIPLSSNSFAAHVARTQENLNVFDAYTDERFDAKVDERTDYKTRSVLCVPICDRTGRLLGVIEALNKREGFFSSQDESMLSKVAEQLGLLLDGETIEYTVDLDHKEESVVSMLSDYHMGLKERKRSVLPIMAWPTGMADRTSELRSWDINVMKHTDEQLLGFCDVIAEQLGLTERLVGQTEALHRWIMDIHASYLPNPYHNWRHGFSVLHATFLVLTMTTAPTLLTFLDIIAVFMAAFAHDVGHLGRTNDFLVKTNDKLAVLYNDRSVLEQHHAALTFQLLNKEGNMFLADLPIEQYRELRKTVVEVILSTDMTHHFELTAELKTRFVEHMAATDSLAGSSSVYSRRTSHESVHGSMLSREVLDDRRLLLKGIVHAADLSNPVLPFELARQWAVRIGQEFFEQAEKERAAGFTVAPHMDFLPSDEIALATSQVNFIDYIVSPLWTCMASFFPALEECTAQMQQNRHLWDSIVSGEEVEGSSVFAHSKSAAGLPVVAEESSVDEEPGKADAGRSAVAAS
eukprot:PLAT13422.1.p1 GENE.PLAT13422.1~~PLAT13422.1.p1  ORF type:complete len:1014 (-),score=409.59 PLAT13422.1:43-3084(-)